MGPTPTSDRLPRWMVPVAAMALFGLHLWLSSHVSDPTVVFDENGYLGNARWLAGHGRWQMPFSPAYASGYPLVLTPVMALSQDPGAQWLGVRVINAALLTAVFPLLVGVLRQVLDTPRTRAVAAAGVGALAPAVLAAGSTATAENLVLALVPAAVLAAWAMTDGGRSLWARVWLGPALVALYAAHPRFTLAVPLTLLALGVAAWRRALPTAVAVANAAVLVLGVVAAQQMNTMLQAARWTGVERLEGGVGDWVSLATSGSGLGELAMTAIGQAWYLAVGTLGLALVGLAVTARKVVGSGVAGHALAQRRRIVLGATLVVAASVFATSVLFFAQNQFRADHYVYGRHNDSFTTLWVAVAFAYLVNRAGSARAVRVAMTSGAVTAVLGVALSVLRDPSDRFDVFSPFAVPGIVRYVGDDPGGTFIRGTLISVVAIAVLTGLVAMSRAASVPARAQRTALALLGLGVSAWFGWFGFGTMQGTQDFHDLIYENWTPAEVIERLEVDELCIDASAVRGRATLSYPWALPDVTVRSYDAAAGESPSCAFAVARLDDVARIEAGDRVVTLDEGGLYSLWDAPEGLAVWVRPGSEADRLARGGALLPEGFPNALPPAARQGSIAIADDFGSTATVAPGDQVTVPITVSHEGESSPWPDVASYGLPERVRVMAEVLPVDPDGSRGARSGGELPRWLLPGDTTQMSAEVVASDERLAPLPPGRYEVTLGIGQEGEDWFAPGGPDATFTLVVAG